MRLLTIKSPALKRAGAEKVLSRLNLTGDETILDAGCGTGRLTAGLLDNLPRGRVLALDISQNS